MVPLFIEQGEMIRIDHVLANTWVVHKTSY